MSGTGLSDHLPDFSENARTGGGGRSTGFSLLFDGEKGKGGQAGQTTFSPLEGREPPPAAPALPPVAPPEITGGIDALMADDLEITLEAAHDSKWEEIEKLTRSHEAEIEALRHKHAEELEARAAEQEAGALSSLAKRLVALEEEIAGIVMSRVAETLTAILGKRIEQDTIRELCEALRPVLQEAGAGTVEVSGPKLLLDKLRLHLSEHTSQMRFTPAEDEDVTATIDEQVLVTRLGEWRKTVEEAGL